MKIKFKWKDQFLDEDWYKDNPAETYLSDKSKQNMILLWINNVPDLDSEAEIVLEADD